MCTCSGSKILMKGEIDSLCLKLFTLSISVKPCFIQSDLRFPSLLELSSYLKLLLRSQQLLTLKPARFRSNVGKLTLSDSLVLIRYAQAGADPGFFFEGVNSSLALLQHQ